MPETPIEDPQLKHSPSNGSATSSDEPVAQVFSTPEDDASTPAAEPEPTIGDDGEGMPLPADT